MDNLEGESSPFRLSPVDTLPYELLAEILILALTPRPRSPYSREMKTASADVLSLCRVSMYWRKDIGHRDPMFLERSAPLPFSIWIHSMILPMKFPDRVERLSQIMDVLVGVKERWRSLAVSLIRAESEMAPLVLIPPGGLDNLEKVDLNFSSRSDSPIPKLGIFQLAPHLRDVRVDVWSGTSDIHLPMPWAQLTSLSLAYRSPQLCLDILVCCENLVSAYIKTEQWLESDVPGKMQTLAHLEELDIFMLICSDGEHLAPFLRLKLPALKSLSLQTSLRLPIDYEFFISWLTPALTSFLPASPNLQSLSLAECVFADDITDILQLTPSLTELVFSDTEVNDDFFMALQYSETDSVHLVPKLETLILGDVGVDFEEAPFADMIRSRWWSDDELRSMPSPPGVVRLKGVTLRNDLLPPRKFSRELQEAVTRYEEQGLQIYLLNWY
ncbi:hypothetical protein C8R43DRAFT_111598 [Mycena crocata]|nr:hypothetical protein C8R43DRAFT_111598 [Mycena crocata]